MASLGQGGAKVDLALYQDHFSPGEEVKGELNVYGGTVEQSIDKIEVSLELEILDHEHHYRQTVSRVPLNTTFSIYPGEQKSFPFYFRLPNNLPVSGHTVSYFFETELDIIGGKDHKDRDPVTIHPPHELQCVLNALQNLGFHEKHDSRSFNGQVQEFELYPTSYFRGQIEEVEFTAAILPDGLDLRLEVEVYSSYGHEKEIKHHVFLDHAMLQDSNQLESYIKNLLEELVHSYGSGSSSHGHYEHHGHYYSDHHGSGVKSAVGGFAAGAIGGFVVSEMLDNDDDDDDDDFDNAIEDFFEDEED
jgi:sporulation-control protein